MKTGTSNKRIRTRPFGEGRPGSGDSTLPRRRFLKFTGLAVTGLGLSGLARPLPASSGNLQPLERELLASVARSVP